MLRLWHTYDIDSQTYQKTSWVNGLTSWLTASPAHLAPPHLNQTICIVTKNPTSFTVITPPRLCRHYTMSANNAKVVSTQPLVGPPTIPLDMHG